MTGREQIEYVARFISVVLEISMIAGAIFGPILAFLLLTGRAHAAAPHWTILHQECWRISATAGQCAVGLIGTFDTRNACIAANNGRLEQKGDEQGRQVAYRCEMKIEE